jgi:hypothetical protein
MNCPYLSFEKNPLDLQLDVVNFRRRPNIPIPKITFYLFAFFF